MVMRRAVPDTVSGGIAIESRAESERSAAFRGLAERHLDDSYALANAILGNPSEAEDAVHDAVITGWRKWASLRDPARFEAWFRRIVVNTCRDHVRRNKRRVTTDIETAAGLAAPDDTHAVHVRIQVEQSLAQLKPDDRIVLALRYYRDLKIDDIAAALDIPSGTATSRLRTAHLRLEKILSQTQPQEGVR